MQRKILFLINPIAGTGKKKHLEDLIQAKTTEKEIPFAIWSTPGDGSYDPIVEHVQSMKYTDICICGGDGTVNAVVHALAHLPVCFSIIPSGSGNGLAYTAGIPKNPRKALDVLFEGVPTETDAFLINDSFACMLAGCGLDAHVAAAFANSSSRGFLTYTRLTMKALIKSSAYAFELTVKNRTWELDAMMITVSNSNQFGNQFTIAPRASLNDGLLDVVIIKKMPVLRFIVSATRQLLIGKPSEMEWNSKSEVIYFQTNQLKVVNKNHAPFHIDGDPQPTPSEMNIRVLPKHFRLIHGKPRRYPTVDK